LERNDFGASPFSELWIVKVEIHESYRNFVSFSGDFVKPLKLESKKIKQMRLKKMHLELEGKTRQSTTIKIFLEGKCEESVERRGEICNC
jgi:hypothetical protein